MGSHSSAVHLGVDLTYIFNSSPSIRSKVTKLFSLIYYLLSAKTLVICSALIRALQDIADNLNVVFGQEIVTCDFESGLATNIILEFFNACVHCCASPFPSSLPQGASLGLSQLLIFEVSDVYTKFMHWPLSPFNLFLTHFKALGMEVLLKCRHFQLF